MSILSDNEMRDLCRRFVILRHEPYSVSIAIDVVAAERHLGGKNQRSREILAQTMEFVRAVAANVMADVQGKLRTTQQVEGIDPHSA